MLYHGICKIEIAKSIVCKIAQLSEEGSKQIVAKLNVNGETGNWILSFTHETDRQFFFLKKKGELEKVLFVWLTFLSLAKGN